MSIEIILLGIILAAFPFVAYLASGADIFFTRLSSGDIKFVMRGESLHRIIHDVRGKELVEVEEPDGTSHFELQNGEEKKNWMNKLFGVWEIGIPPFSSIHKFRISVEIENLNAKTKEEWVIHKEPREVSSLRFTFPRPYLQAAVELKDRLSVDILSIATFEVVRPYIPVFNFKGGFFEVAGSMIEGAVIDRIKAEDLVDFMSLQKGVERGVLKDMTEPDSEFNRELIKLVGLRLVSLPISKYDPSDTRTRAAMEALALAIKDGEAKVAAAKLEADAIVARAEGQAKAEERLAVSRGSRVRETVAGLATSNADPNVVGEGAARILEKEAVAGPDSSITTWAEGGSAQAVLPVAIPGGTK